MDERNQALGGRGESSWLVGGSLERASSVATQLQSILSLQQSQDCHVFSPYVLNYVSQ
jgi:hypothetical protein